MTFVVSEASLGMPEASWAASPKLAALPALAWGAPCHVVVVAPHPDDETLGVGGVLHALARRGFTFTVVAVTDGEGSHPRSPTLARDGLVARRLEERRRALGRLGLGDAEVRRLAFADRGVEPVEELARRLDEPLRGTGLCLVTYRHDGHRDHDACGAAAALACARRGVQLLEYPVWIWHWARPDGDEFPWSRARRVPLDPEARAAKDAAIREYVTQIAPLSGAPGDEVVLPPEVLAHFARPYEVLFE